MTRSDRGMAAGAGAVVLVLVLGLAGGWGLMERRGNIRVVPVAQPLPADGREHTLATIYPPRWQRLRAEELQSNSNNGLRFVSRGAGPGDAGVDVMVRAPVGASRQTFRLAWRRRITTLQQSFVEDGAPSSVQPGLPDWMPLHSADDRRSFRRWFTGLADRTADAAPKDLPLEIADCSALLRYSFRESLRQHDDRWFAEAPEIERLTFPSVQQWSYPNTPLGASLFRTRAGTFVPADLQDGTFAQFADAKTLTTANTFFVSRDLRSARPGDLLFYRLLELDSHHHQQYHSMIVTGEHAEWVVYHTGPVSAPDGTQTKGEMRRVLLKDLLHHPDPRWRPAAANTNFLGVYRWDILAED